MKKFCGFTMFLTLQNRLGYDSISSMCDAFGITRNTVHRLRAGESSMQLRVLERISNQCDIPMSEIIAMGEINGTLKERG